jgi:putative membrane protein
MFDRRRWFGSNEDSLVRFAFRILVNAAAIWLASQLHLGITPLNNIVALLLVGLILGILNALIKPIFQFITCPLEILTLGLFTLVINAIMLLLTSWIAQQLSIPFQVNGFVAAFLGALVISIVSWLLTQLV